MLCDLTVPSILPVMILPGGVLLPHSSIGLQISDPPSLELFNHIIDHQRLFIVAPELPGKTAAPRALPAQSETAKNPGGTLCLLRAAHRKPGPALELIIQGLCRSELLYTHLKSPVPSVAFRPLLTEPIEDEGEISALMDRIKSLIVDEETILGPVPPPFIQFLQSIEHPEIFVDILASALNLESQVSIQLLHSTNLLQRYVWISEQLCTRLENKANTGDLTDQRPNGHVR